MVPLDPCPLLGCTSLPCDKYWDAPKRGFRCAVPRIVTKYWDAPKCGFGCAVPRFVTKQTNNREKRMKMDPLPDPETFMPRTRKSKQNYSVAPSAIESESDESVKVRTCS